MKRRSDPAITLKRLLKFDQLCRRRLDPRGNSWEVMRDHMQGENFNAGRGTMYDYKNQLIDLGASFKPGCFEYKDPEQVIPDLQDLIEQQRRDSGRELLEVLEHSQSDDSMVVWMKLFLRAMLDAQDATFNAVSIYENLDLKEVKDNFETLLGYILHHQPIEFYQLNAGRPHVKMHPYMLKNYNSRWFLIGKSYNDEPRPGHPDEYYEDYSATPLHDITEIKPWDVKFIEPDYQDLKDYFEEFVGVTPDRENGQQTVYLKFEPLRYQKYVATKPLSLDQKLVREGAAYYDPERPVLKMPIHCNRELEQQILSFGPDVEVLAPESLRQRIAAKVAEMNAKYQPKE